MKTIVINAKQLRQLATKGSVKLDDIEIVYEKNSPKPEAVNESKVAKFLAYIKDNLGKPYVLGGTGRNDQQFGFDCSGLVKNGLIMCGIELFPRISTNQYEKGEVVKYGEEKAGDLIFFKTEANDRRPNHLGVITDIDKKLMINANSYEGKVVEESYTAKYWNERFVGIKRIFITNNFKES